MNLDLSGADLSGLALANVSLLQDVILRDSNFRGSDVSQDQLLRINARNADLRNAVFDETRIRDSDFRGANFDESSWRGAQTDWCTRWPDGFDLEDRGVVRVGVNEVRCSDGRRYRGGELIENANP
jgi:hypothetical protein